MNAENCKGAANIFRELVNNCIQILKNVGVDGESVKTFEKAGQVLLQECLAVYNRKKQEESKDGKQG